MGFHSAQLHAQEPVKWGEPISGLRLSLSIDYESKELLFSIQNVSDKHTQLVALGENGIPASLTVTLTTRDGKIQDSELGMSSAMHAMGAGIYEHVVEMLPKSTYVISHAMDDFTPIAMASDASRAFPLTTLKSGDLITGHLRGRYRKCPPSSCRASDCWEGYLASNTVQAK